MSPEAPIADVVDNRDVRKATSGPLVRAAIRPPASSPIDVHHAPRFTNAEA